MSDPRVRRGRVWFARVLVLRRTGGARGAPGGMVAAERICPDRHAQESAGDDACDDRKRHAARVEIEQLCAATITYGLGMGRQLPPAELDESVDPRLPCAWSGLTTPRAYSGQSSSSTS